MKKIIKQYRGSDLETETLNFVGVTKIAISMGEKDYMKIIGSTPENLNNSIQITYGDNTTEIIQVGKTFIYEPGDEFNNITLSPVKIDNSNENYPYPKNLIIDVIEEVITNS